MNKDIGDNIDTKGDEQNNFDFEKSNILNFPENEDINDFENKEIVEDTPNSIATNNEQVKLASTENKHILGKFDSVDALMDAYNSLQAEFTRKSQELANYKRNSNSPQSYDLIESLQEFNEKLEASDEFLQSLSQKFLDDEKLINDKFGLSQAVYSVMNDKMEANARNLQSNDFVYNLVNERGELKEKIINDYINECNKGKVPPLMVDTFGANIAASSPKSPTSLEEVATIMNKWLEK